ASLSGPQGTTGPAFKNGPAHALERSPSEPPPAGRLRSGAGVPYPHSAREVTPAPAPVSPAGPGGAGSASAATAVRRQAALRASGPPPIESVVPRRERTSREPF